MKAVNLRGAWFGLMPLMLALSGCNAGSDAATRAVERAGTDAVQAAPGGLEVVTAGRLVLTVDSVHTAPDARRCILDVTARNDTDVKALNVQAAWMAQTEGFGNISDYQVLGDFEVGEVRSLQLAVFGTPCDALRELKLSRAVCTVGPVDDPPKSCADLVVLDARRALGAR